MSEERPTLRLEGVPDAPPRWKVTFHLDNGHTHRVREPLTSEQVAGIRTALDQRLHPQPPPMDPDELPVDDDGKPVLAAASASFRFDFGDQVLIVPARKVSHITAERDTA